MRNMELDDIYNNLGTEEGEGFDNSQMKEQLVKEYYCQVWQILKTDLNSKNNITAANTLVVTVLVYSFRTGIWLRKEIENVAKKMRKFLTTERIHHPRQMIIHSSTIDEMMDVD
jgi:flagellar biosynthesis regulator FlaF